MFQHLQSHCPFKSPVGTLIRTQPKSCNNGIRYNIRYSSSALFEVSLSDLYQSSGIAYDPQEVYVIKKTILRGA